MAIRRAIRRRGKHDEQNANVIPFRDHHAEKTSKATMIYVDGRYE